MSPLNVSWPDNGPQR